MSMEDAALYQALHRLEARAWVASEWGLSENDRRARFYTLTPAGREQLRAEVSAWRPGCRYHRPHARVGPAFFHTIGMPLLAGRAFSAADTLGAPRVAVVNEAFARKFDPLVAASSVGLLAIIAMAAALAPAMRVARIDPMRALRWTSRACPNCTAPHAVTRHGTKHHTWCPTLTTDDNRARTSSFESA